ncbi:MAG: hypothetical protein K0S61_2845 [Anaerocolumna sp.]|jgi:two-component system sensor histidine kinase VanS|nr:hypothetical protein [Anaerocolumna sp.]
MWVIIYTIGLITFFYLARLFLSKFTWYWSNPLYPLLNIINNNAEFFLIGVWLIGTVAIFLFYWFKILGYLEYMIHGTESIYNSKEEYISMPPELKEVENQLNQIKLNVRQNEKAAKDAEQRKNDLVVYLAHDLKTPLTSVIGYLSLLHEEKEISKALQDKYLSITLEKAERLEDLINEFFEITRFNLTNLTLDISLVNITRMLEQIVFEAGPMLRDKNLTCRLEAEPDITIKCDVNKMQRVFDNLIRNAVNYSFRDSEIKIIVKRVENDISFLFVNKGNTIPGEKLERIFEQFFRLDSARQSKSGGSGLGLAIAKEIVELHKGKITAYSQNEEVSFHIKMPI